ncbi:sulfite exporter TauE/SafE family protein [Stenotrophomonas geniculata]|nr:sulfite exporter TauE/SafE family protein [Stenotrophomonas geniculata]RTY19790.1 sulfite exporter TauE/SafE family protein [Stenotrophomonas geniculata]
MNSLSIAQHLLGAGSGVLIGFVLALVGGGGSILAVPLLLYVVRVPDPHVAIGTSALAVAANAATNLVIHARRGNVSWGPAGIFAGAGVLGAYIGSSAGKSFDGDRLLSLFAFLMIAVAGLMLWKRNAQEAPQASLNHAVAARLSISGATTGLVSGFFGIGGGFLVVPGLLASTGMPILTAVGSSLVAVTAFGLTTALNYAHAGLVNWTLAIAFLLGGLTGGQLGASLAERLSKSRGALNKVFAGVILATALYMLAS